MRNRIFASSLTLALAATLNAQDPIPPRDFATANALAKEPRWLSLRWSEFDTRGPSPVLPAELRSDPPAADRVTTWIAQCKGPITGAIRSELEAAGLVVLDYVPNYAFVVRGNRAAIERAHATGTVVWSDLLHPAYRIAPELLTLAADRPHRLVVVAFADVAGDVFTAQLAAAGARIESTEFASLQRWQATVTVGREGVTALARSADVLWVQEEPRATPRNDTMTWTVQTGIANDRKIWNQGLHGEGQVIGHMDGSILTTSCYFQDPVNPIGPNHRKLVYNSGTGSDSHGTHTAGTAAGDPFPINATTTNRGLAWAARLAHTTGYPTTTFGSVAGTHGTNGARVHTNSWGDDANSNYDAFCAAVDTFAWNNEDHLVCFAITNLNRMVTHPDVAKNLLAVGSSGNGASANSTCFSGGFGPTLDGRRKPEVYTPGCSIVSAGTSACNTATMTGSSMACPSTTAAAALVRQYFMDGFYPTGVKVPALGFVPTGALVKAMLVNSANDMTGIANYPSGKEGWGKIVLDQGLPFAGDAEHLFAVDVRRADGLVTGNTSTYLLPVVGNAVPLRITLAFQDAPGLANASNPVVNDVDLVVIAPDSTVYRGNAIDALTGWSLPAGTADAKNNVERVLVTNPAVGVWTIKVVATNVPQGKQGFALCATGAISPNPTFAANLAYGTGKGGSNGVPVLAANSLPRVGNPAYSVTLTLARPNTNLGWFFGTSTATLPFDGGTLLVTPLDGIPLVSSATGTASLPLAIPDDYALCGVSLYSQFWVIGDPGAAGFGFACSQGLQTRIGN